jgi:hypothetical protein
VRHGLLRHRSRVVAYSSIPLPLRARASSVEQKCSRPFRPRFSLSCSCLPSLLWKRPARYPFPLLRPHLLVLAASPFIQSICSYTFLRLPSSLNDLPLPSAVQTSYTPIRTPSAPRSFLLPRNNQPSAPPPINHHGKLYELRVGYARGEALSGSRKDPSRGELPSCPLMAASSFLQPSQYLISFSLRTDATG